MPAPGVVDDPAVARAYARMRRALTGVLTIGVTGTKGKTSTTEFIAQLMESRGLRTAVSTTESARIGARHHEPCETIQDLHHLVLQAHRSGIDCFVVELVSYGLMENLHLPFDFDVAVLTNIGTDHIREHGNRRNYIAAKQRMFRDLARGPASPRPVAILNADDGAVGAFLAVIGADIRIVTYGTTGRVTPARPVERHVAASRLSHDRDGTSFLVTGLRRRPLPCRTALHGAFNVSNVLAALACGVALGAEPEDVAGAAACFLPPPGRFDPVTRPSPDQPGIIVDYAHTPESLGSALDAARTFAPRGRVHVVFGCGGNAYKGKRAVMGRIAADKADSVLITSDNPRREDPAAIARDILRGVAAHDRARVRVELDRKKAIAMAIAAAQGGDMVMLLGKGNERTQEVNGRQRPFSDARVARRAFAARLRDQTAAAGLRLDAVAAVVMTEDAGHVLFARNEQLLRPPASLVKLMTMLVAFEAVAQGRVGLRDRVTISRYAALTPHPRLTLRAGDRVTLRTLLAATAIRSSNLAATAVAEHVAGAEGAFVSMMNARAAALGLTATRFATPHGLPHRLERSTAADLARLTRELVGRHPASRELLARRGVRCVGRAYRRTVPLLGARLGVQAVKTGFTWDAGYNLAITWQRGGRRLVGVLLGAASRAGSFADARRILRHVHDHDTG
ncbi:MAG TPA: UDP-N-acetylmuramyl-tripeptide synthetase [Vicinamibacterales bacterium]|nr:UDP-N-acetylmuramyl-tripeptide synthetase [Vicinamibacterales bacterium]